VAGFSASLRSAGIRIAVIVNIHGNMPALEAVLADIKHRSVAYAINLGDCVSAPLWPREVSDLLMASDLTTRGNHDRWMSGPDLARTGTSDRYAYSQLDSGTAAARSGRSSRRGHLSVWMRTAGT
jgi:hypothetical protein